MTSFNARLLLVLWAQTRSARPRFTAHAVRDWLGRIGVKTLYIEPGSPWENGYNESFNSKLRDEILNTEIFYTLKEANVQSVIFKEHEGSFLVGMAAALASKTGKISFIGGTNDARFGGVGDEQHS